MPMRSKSLVLPQKNKYAVILVRPEGHENIGLVARNMKNTGFRELRFVGVSELGERAFLTAVHAKDILDSAQFFSSLDTATADCGVVFASTSKERKNFSLLPLEDAVEKMSCYAQETKIGLLFGNERTGLTSGELRHSNFRFKIPQSTAQPSYNLASAVLLSLFRIFTYKNSAPRVTPKDKPLSRHNQEECIRRILISLEDKGFIHSTNRTHVHEMIHDLFGRLVLTEKDGRLLLALFSKGVGG